jgi:hypothetical protein
MPENFEIYFERSGGFLGRTVSVEIKSDTLPLQEREQIEALINNSGFMTLQFPENTVHKSPDRFQYQITIEKANKTNTIAITESNLMEELKPIVDLMMEKARKLRK